MAAKYCDICKYSTNDVTNYKKHLNTSKHKRMADITDNGKDPVDDTNISYYCECCDFTTKNKYDFTRHNGTKKHKLNELKKCSPIVEENSVLNIQSKSSDLNSEIVMELLKQNKEIQTTLLEQNKELQNTILEMSKQKSIINNTNITNNNQFNLAVFLNEDCKNALSIAEFVDSLKLSVADIEETGKLGFTEGITRIFVQALKDLDVKRRPIHCTDSKRETVYIKDQDNWEKENAEKTKLRNAVKQIARKNLKMLPEWQEKNPGYRYLDTPENEQYIQISLNALGPATPQEEIKQEDKILRNVLKEVTLRKGT
jgi:hypothetical protein